MLAGPILSRFRKEENLPDYGDVEVRGPRVVRCPGGWKAIIEEEEFSLRVEGKPWLALEDAKRAASDTNACMVQWVAFLPIKR